MKTDAQFARSAVNNVRLTFPTALLAASTSCPFGTFPSSSLAECFHTSFGKVERAVARLVEWGLQHRCLDNVTSIGIEEVQIHKYVTLVYQIDSGNKRLLGVVEELAESLLEHFFTEFDAGTEVEERSCSFSHQESFNGCGE